MIETKHTQSLVEFRNKVDTTIERLNCSGDAEIITLDGQACAVLISPSIYGEMARAWEVAQDVAAIRKAMQEFDEGKTRLASDAFDELHAKLLAMKAAKK